MPLWWPDEELVGDKIDQAKKRFEALTTNVRGMVSEPILLARARRNFDRAADDIISRTGETLSVGDKLAAARNRFEALTAGISQAPAGLEDLSRRTAAGLEQAGQEFVGGWERMEGRLPAARAAGERLTQTPGIGFPEALGENLAEMTGTLRRPLEAVGERIGRNYQGGQELAAQLGAGERTSALAGGVLAGLGAGQSVMGQSLEAASRNVGVSPETSRRIGDVGEALAPTPLKADVFGPLTRGRLVVSGLGGVAGAGAGAALSPEDERVTGALTGLAGGVQAGAGLLDLAQSAGRLGRNVAPALSRLSRPDLAQSAVGAGVGATTGPEDQTPQDRLKRAFLGFVAAPGFVRSAQELARLRQAPEALDRMRMLRIAGDNQPDLFDEDLAGDLARVTRGIETRMSDWTSLSEEHGRLQEEIGALREFVGQGNVIEKPPNRGVWSLGSRKGWSAGDLAELARRSDLNPFAPNWWQAVDDETIRLYKSEVMAERGRVVPPTPQQELQRLNARERDLRKQVRTLDQELMQDITRQSQIEDRMARRGIAAPPREPEAPVSGTPEAPEAPVSATPGQVSARRRLPTMEETTVRIRTRPRGPRVTGEAPPPRAPEPGRVLEPLAEGVQPQATVPLRPPGEAVPPSGTPGMTPEEARAAAQGAIIDPATGRPVAPERLPQAFPENAPPEAPPRPGSAVLSESRSPLEPQTEVGRIFPENDPANRPPTPDAAEGLRVARGVVEGGGATPQEVADEFRRAAEAGEITQAEADWIVANLGPEARPGIAIQSTPRGPLEPPTEVGRVFPGNAGPEPRTRAVVQRDLDAAHDELLEARLRADQARQDAATARIEALEGEIDRLPVNILVPPGPATTMRAPGEPTAARARPPGPMLPGMTDVRVPGGQVFPGGINRAPAGPPAVPPAGPPRPPGPPPGEPGGVEPPAGNLPLDIATDDVVPGTTRATTWLQQMGKVIGQSRYIGLLSGTAGAFGDVISNTFNIPRLYARTAGGAGIEAAFRVPLEERATTGSQIKGLNRGFREGAMQGVKEAWDVFMHGFSPAQLEQEARYEQRLANMTARLQARGRAVPRTVGRTGTIINPDLPDTPAFRGKKWLPLALGYRIRLAADSLVTSIGERMSSYSLGYREADRAGLKGGTAAHTEYAENVARHIQGEMERIRLSLKPGERVPQGGVTQRARGAQGPLGDRLDYNALAREAFATSRDLAFQRELGTVSGALAEFRGKSTGIGWVVPFYRTSSRIAQDMLQEHPVVGLAGSMGDMIKAAYGQGPYAATDVRQTGRSILARSSSAAVIPLSQRLTDHAMGLLFAVTGGALAANGVITGLGPTDASVRRRMQDEGWRPLSWVVPDGEGGTAAVIPLTRLLGPHGMSLGLGAVAWEAWQRGEGEPPGRLIQDFIISQEGQWSQQAGLRDFYELLNAVYSPDPEEAGRAVERMMANVVGQYIPLVGLQRQFGQVTDPYIRDPRNWQERLMNDTIVWRWQVDPRRTETGQEVTRGEGERGVWAFLPGQRISTIPSQRQFYGSASAQEDAEITQAINAVQNYRKDRYQYREPTDRQTALYYQYVGQRSPVFTRERAEERRRRRVRAREEEEAFLGFRVPTSGG